MAAALIACLFAAQDIPPLGITGATGPASVAWTDKDTELVARALAEDLRPSLPPGSVAVFSRVTDWPFTRSTNTLIATVKAALAGHTRFVNDDTAAPFVLEGEIAAISERDCTVRQSFYQYWITLADAKTGKKQWVAVRAVKKRVDDAANTASYLSVSENYELDLPFNDRDLTLVMQDLGGELRQWAARAEPIALVVAQDPFLGRSTTAGRMLTARIEQLLIASGRVGVYSVGKNRLVNGKRVLVARPQFDLPSARQRPHRRIALRGREGGDERALCVQRVEEAEEDQDAVALSGAAVT